MNWMRVFKRQQRDATRAALERIARDGSDLSRQLKMDFFVAVPDEMSGRIMAVRVGKLGDKQAWSGARKRNRRFFWNTWLLGGGHGIA
ncbi:ribonuclease E inhibitor RraB [Pendulispora rubella]|uniref:ribonuclease E inhibitor RraB n=1 Tax=Pendulispora rubella TaxID=2741070 RepID=UPI00374E0BA7